MPRRFPEPGSSFIEHWTGGSRSTKFPRWLGARAPGYQDIRFSLEPVFLGNSLGVSWISAVLSSKEWCLNPSSTQCVCVCVCVCSLSVAVLEVWPYVTVYSRDLKRDVRGFRSVPWYTFGFSSQESCLHSSSHNSLPYLCFLLIQWWRFFARMAVPLKFGLC